MDIESTVVIAIKMLEGTEQFLVGEKLSNTLKFEIRKIGKIKEKPLHNLHVFYPLVINNIFPIKHDTAIIAPIIASRFHPQR